MGVGFFFYLFFFSFFSKFNPPLFPAGVLNCSDPLALLKDQARSQVYCVAYLEGAPNAPNVLPVMTRTTANFKSYNGMATVEGVRARCPLLGFIF